MLVFWNGPLDTYNLHQVDYLQLTRYQNKLSNENVLSISYQKCIGGGTINVLTMCVVEVYLITCYVFDTCYFSYNTYYPVFVITLPLTQRQLCCVVYRLSDHLDLCLFVLNIIQILIIILINNTNITTTTNNNKNNNNNYSNPLSICNVCELGYITLFSLPEFKLKA